MKLGDAVFMLINLRERWARQVVAGEEDSAAATERQMREMVVSLNEWNLDLPEALEDAVVHFDNQRAEEKRSQESGYPPGSRLL